MMRHWNKPKQSGVLYLSFIQRNCGSTSFYIWIWVWPVFLYGPTRSSQESNPAQDIEKEAFQNEISVQQKYQTALEEKGHELTLMEAENRMIKEHLKIVNTDLSFKMSLKDDEIQAWQKKILFTQEKWNTVQGEYKQVIKVWQGKP